MINQAKIYRLVQSKDVEERKRAIEELKNNFSIFKVNEHAWNDMIVLTQGSQARGMTEAGRGVHTLR